MSQLSSVPFIESDHAYTTNEVAIGNTATQPQDPSGPQANLGPRSTAAIDVASSVTLDYQRKIDAMSTELTKATKDQQTMRRDLERSEQKANRAALEVTTLSERLEAALRQVEETGARNNEAEEKLRKAETELRGLKTMLTTHNESSDMDVSRLLDVLNHHIEDFATTGARYWLNRRGQFHHPVTENTRQHLRGLLGNQLSDAILYMTADDRFAPLVLQYGWQAAIIKTVRRILQLFSLDTPSPTLEDIRSQDGHYYAGLANQVMEGEVQATYGHWRSLTHRYLRESLPDRDKRARADNQVHIILEDCYKTTVLLFNDGCPSKEEFVGHSLKEVADIIEHAVQLATIIKESIITRNYEPHAPKGGEAFDPTSMEVEEDESPATPNDVISCTLQLGLKYTVKEGHRASPTTSAMFRKAKVLTSSELDSLIPRARAQQNHGGQGRAELAYGAATSEDRVEREV